MQTRGRFIILVAVTLCCLGTAQSREDPEARVVRFNRDIRPILSDNCFQCHGPDEGTRKARLRLDLEEEVRAERDGYRIVTPGHPEESEMYLRMTASHADEMMPPPESGRKLTARQIGLVRQWIEEGANWEAHWSYLRPVKPELPEVKNRSWPRNAIDHFVLARLEALDLGPAPEADRRTLMRRLSFDLRGLPPAAEEVAEFLDDASPEAYEKVVDRFLASPQYGERMAMHWLDLVRYADTDGFHSDNYRSVFPYRDYVIAAFNENLPFNRFTVEQIAGDLLPEAGTRQKIASTYNRLNRTTEEGGSQPKEYLAKYAGDRVRTTSSVWMGGTLGCAECHDHKFDPYTIKDFYRFAAYFADINEVGVGKPQGIMAPDEWQEAELKRFDAGVAELESTLRTPTEELGAAQERWESNLRAQFDAGTLGWSALKPESFSSAQGTELRLLEDQSLLAAGENPDQEIYAVTFRPERERISAIRLEALRDESLDKGSLSRGGVNFVLTGFEAELVSGDGSESRKLKIARAVADYAQGNFPVHGAIDGKTETGWAVDGHSKVENRRAAFIFAEPVSVRAGDRLKVQLKHESRHKRHQMGRFRLSSIAVDQPVLAEFGIPEEVARAWRLPVEERTEQQREEVAAYFLSIAPELAPVREKLAAVKREKEEYEKTISTTLATVAVEPRVMRVLPRGDWLNDSGEIVTPGVPEFLASGRGDAGRATRLDLAEWLVSRENPLTARVLVNRVWKLFFGTGISKVLDDFGSQGEWPTHPALLDWLAVEFMESGWDVKQLVKLKVMSGVYRQNSQPRGELRERDPYNRLLARQSRFRLEAEMVRDNALAVSGLLVEKVGGPSVKPYQPAGYWAQLNFPKREYQPDEGEALYRRGLYTFWCRTFLHPSLLAFDAPSREECVLERVTSNTPMQALVLLNDPTYVEAARVFAAEIMSAHREDQVRMRRAFQKALARAPLAEEARILEELLAAEKERYARDPAAAEQLVNVGEWPSPPERAAVELAAWTSVARAILNLHETIARY